MLTLLRQGSLSLILLPRAFPVLKSYGEIHSFTWSLEIEGRFMIPQHMFPSGLPHWKMFLLVSK
jgi:hypothetical protein